MEFWIFFPWSSWFIQSLMWNANITSISYSKKISFLLKVFFLVIFCLIARSKISHTYITSFLQRAYKVSVIILHSWDFTYKNNICLNVFSLGVFSILPLPSRLTYLPSLCLLCFSPPNFLLSSFAMSNHILIL